MQTPSIRFRPRNEKHFTNPILQGYISIYGKEAPKWSSQLKILPQFKWNQKAQTFCGNSLEENANNSILDSIRATVKNCFTLMQSEKSIITAVSLKKRFLSVWEKEPQKIITVLEIYDKYVLEKDNQDLEEKTMTRYYDVRNHLLRFLSSINHSALTIEELNIFHGTQFFKFLCKSVTEPTAKRYVQYLIASVNHAFENGIIQRNSILDLGLKAKSNPINKNTVTETQQLEIYRLDDLTKTERHIADLTTFMFYTGFDFCDFLNFDKTKHIENNCLIKVRYKMRKKLAAEPIIISLNNIMIEILDSYPKFPIYTDETMRKIYRNLCSRVGVKDFHLLGMKALRKSAGNFYLNNDVPMITVSSKILGHTTQAMTQRHYTTVEKEKVIRDTLHLKNR